MRLAIVAVALLLLGCTSTGDSFKLVTYERGSINLHPFPVLMIEGENEGGENELILPDGSYVTLTGTGSAGNLYLITNQNDGTEQTTKAEVEAKLDADANVNSPGSATGGSDASPVEVPVPEVIDG